MSFWQELEQRQQGLKDNNLARSLKTVPPGTLDLSSNDYLGLARHPRVAEAACRAARQFGSGARASRLVGGHLPEHTALEAELASWKGCEAALVFSSGYAANLGLLGSLAHSGARFLCHKRNHASLVDGCRLAQSLGAQVRYFEDWTKLTRLLATPYPGQTFIVVDGVFSMDGDVFDLRCGLELARQHDAMIVLDDAHGTGTLGPTGKGLSQHCGLSSEETQDRLITVGTLSKALGSQGGFVAGRRLLVDFLVGNARSFVFSTGLNPPAAAAAQEALAVLQEEPARVQRLQENAARLFQLLTEAGCQLACRQPLTPIISILLGDAGLALACSARLREAGVWCPAIRPPTVAAGTSRVRLTVCSEWQEAEWKVIRSILPLLANP